MKKFLASLVCCAGVIAASPVSVSLVNPTTPTALPYTMNIAGQSVPVLGLDDFFQSSGTWNADLTAVNSTDLTNTYMGNTAFQIGGYNVTSSEVYTAEAYLLSEIVQPGADTANIQDAAFTLMDVATGHAPQSPSTDVVHSLLIDAALHVSSFDPSYYFVVSEDNALDPSNAKQEFMVMATPEPASGALLGGALVLLGMTQIWSKKRKQATANL